MMLTGPQIYEEYKKGSIEISPFNESQLNPNSYNLRLSNRLLVYTGAILDMKTENPVEEIIIPEEGFLLKPGFLYLGETVEYTKTNEFVACLDGRSSVGRLGINVHATAGFGDIGFGGKWTLEISTNSKLVRVYPNVEICQVYYYMVYGEKVLYNGKYNNAMSVEPSKIYKELGE